MNKNKDLLVSVIDIRGKTLLSEKYYEANKIDINTAQFASGIYFVNLKYTDFSETKKIIVTHQLRQTLLARVSGFCPGTRNRRVTYWKIKFTKKPIL